MICYFKITKFKILIAIIILYFIQKDVVPQDTKFCNCKTSSINQKFNQNLIDYFENYFKLGPIERCDFFYEKVKGGINVVYFIILINDLEILSDTVIEYQDIGKVASIENELYNINDSILLVKVKSLKERIIHKKFILNKNKTNNVEYVYSNNFCGDCLLKLYVCFPVRSRIKFIKQNYKITPIEVIELFKSDLDHLLDCNTIDFVEGNVINKRKLSYAIKTWKRKL